MVSRPTLGSVPRTEHAATAYPPTCWKLYCWQNRIISIPQMGNLRDQEEKGHKDGVRRCKQALDSPHLSVTSYVIVNMLLASLGFSFLTCQMGSQSLSQALRDSGTI